MKKRHSGSNKSRRKKRQYKSHINAMIEIGQINYPDGHWGNPPGDWHQTGKGNWSHQ